jgi:arylsulfatase A-like enzyme
VARAAKPALLLFIAVDQMREDYLERWRPQLTGGLKRLLDGGAFFTDAHQDHAVTETAPGHASMLSGRFPRSTGIIRNTAGVIDSAYPLVGGPGPGASPRRFRGTTLADWLLAANPATRVLSLSMKDRAAILMIGRAKQPVYWYSPAGAFVTSRWYADSLPDWVKSFNARDLARANAGRVWDLLLPASAYAEPDSESVENRGVNFVFPHRLTANRDSAAALLVQFPFMDDLEATFALQGVRSLHLGQGPETDLLAVSFSGTDLVGHAYGPDSREIHDQVLRFDRLLGSFLDSLYAQVDSTRVIIVLTADHGIQPFPEENHGRLHPAPTRANLTWAVEAARRVIERGQGNPKAVEFETGALLISPDSVRAAEPVVRAAVDSFLAEARAVPGVLRADRFSDYATADLGKDKFARRWVQMFSPEVPVEAVVTLTEGSYWWFYPIAQHGTPHDQDTHVPVVFYGAPFRPGRYGQFARTVDIAPTLAQVLGVAPMEPLDGRPLAAAIR